LNDNETDLENPGPGGVLGTLTTPNFPLIHMLSFTSWELCSKRDGCW